jgi:hypothetical protein
MGGGSGGSGGSGGTGGMGGGSAGSGGSGGTGGMGGGSAGSGGTGGMGGGSAGMGGMGGGSAGTGGTGGGSGPTIELHGVVRLADQIDPSLTEIYLDNTLTTATTATDGSYVVPNVPVGTHTLRFVYGDYTETIPEVDAILGSHGMVPDSAGPLYPLTAPLTIPHARRLASAPSPDRVHVSPDGTMAAVIAGQQLVLTPVGGGASASAAASAFIAFTPDSQSVVYAPASGAPVLRPLHGGAARTLAGAGDCATASGSIVMAPDSKHLLCMLANADWRLVSLDDGSGVTFTAWLSLGFDHSTLPPTFSPDGSHLVWIDVQGNLVGSAVATLTPSQLLPTVVQRNPSSAAFGPIFSFGGGKLAIASNVTSPIALTVIDLNTLALSPVASSIVTTPPFLLSPDGRYIGYISGPPAVGYLADRDGQHATEAGLPIGFTADGKRYVYGTYDSSQSGSMALFSVPTTGTRTVATITAAEALTPLLSPDSTHVLFTIPGGNQGKDAVYAATLDGSNYGILFDPSLYPGSSAYSFTSDGGYVLFSTGPGQLDLRSIAIGGGNVSEWGNVNDCVSAPDGKHLVAEVQAVANGTLATIAMANGTVSLYDGLGSRAVWLDSSHFVYTHSGAAPPYSFQDGVYLARVTP